MNLKTSIKQIIPALGLLLFVSSCSDNDKSRTTETDKKENPKEAAKDSNDAKMSDKQEDNANYVVDAYSASMYEVKASEGAKAKASAKDVKDIAAMMVTAHTKMNGMIKDLAAKKQITLPADLTQDQKDKIAKCGEKNGKDFDKAYVDDLVSGHKDVQDLLQKASDKSTDADIKAWANNSLPEIQKHLAMAKNVQDKLK